MEENIKVIANNKKAFHDYLIFDKFCYKIYINRLQSHYMEEFYVWMV